MQQLLAIYFTRQSDEVRRVAKAVTGIDADYLFRAMRSSVRLYHHAADAPMKPPYDLFIQGGSHRAHVKIALIHALSNLFQAGLIKLPQND